MGSHADSIEEEPTGVESPQKDQVDPAPALGEDPETLGRRSRTKNQKAVSSWIEHIVRSVEESDSSWDSSPTSGPTMLELWEQNLGASPASSARCTSYGSHPRFSTTKNTIKLREWVDGLSPEGSSVS